MELWIRSQDKKTLSIAKNIRLDRYLGGKENNIISNDFFEIGKYKTEERALEVLDEIQNLLQPKIKYIQEEPIESIVDFGYQIKQNVDMKIQEINRIVYNMPKEWLYESNRYNAKSSK